RGRLSGLLIGSELAVVDLARGERVALIGEKTLCDLYYDALTALGCAPQLYDGETMVLRGLSSVYAKLGSGTEPSRLRGAL
ncbi:MAG: 2-dehydro-3-deoxygalactonokinase, partial [Pseudomonadota bacterium]